jgi:hypothetical protein
MSLVEVRHASMIFGADENRHAAFEDTSLKVKAGLIGSSGGHSRSARRARDQET